MNDRLTRLRAELAEHSLDGLYVSSPVDDVTRRHSQNRRYLAGFTGSTGHVVVSQEAAILAVDSRYVQQAGEQAAAHGFEVFHFRGAQEDWLPELLDAAGLKGKALGLSQADLSYGAYVDLADTVEEMAASDRPALVPAPPLVERLRSVKDAEEIATLTRAIGIAETAFEEVHGALEPGTTEREMADLLEAAVKRHGARGFSFEPIIGAGENGAMPHAALTDREIGAGEPVVVDWGAEVDGYCSDLTRTFYLGGEPEMFREVYEVVLAAQTAAIEGIEAGMTGSDADHMARSVIAEAGYGDHFTHGLGHGVGLEVHDYPPYLGASSDDVLEEGMVFTIEPGIYIPGWGGVRIEDIVVMEGGRARLLSTLSRALPAGESR